MKYPPKGKSVFDYGVTLWSEALFLFFRGHKKVTLLSQFYHFWNTFLSSFEHKFSLESVICILAGYGRWNMEYNVQDMEIFGSANK